uniref:Uncharacterized protein n=1 Tax=Oryza rufipogon TaxID=4529 RepID=A0A0E0NUV5_ORYRU
METTSYRKVFSAPSAGPPEDSYVGVGLWGGGRGPIRVYDTSSSRPHPQSHRDRIATRQPPPAGRIPVASSFGGSDTPSSLAEPPAEDFHQVGGTRMY